MMLGGVFTKVGAAGFPLQEELILACPILDTIEVHVNNLGALLFNGVAGKTFGGGVVDADRSWWLGMHQFG